MLKNAKFIKNSDLQVEDRNTWNNMGFNDKSKLLPDKGGIPYFKRGFTVSKPVTSANITATALGIFELFINGIRIGESTDRGMLYDELKPGWTDYSHRVFAFNYDVTAQIKPGDNLILSEVSCGWYSCRISFGIYGFKPPAFCCELEINYADGTSERIATDENWLTALGGPVRTADIWDGEYYDARCTHDSEAERFAEIEEYNGKVVPAAMPRILIRTDLERKPQTAVRYNGVTDNGSDYGEIRVLEEKRGAGCERMTLNRGDRLVLDMGQDAVGRPQLNLRAKRGTKLTIYFGEFLNDSGDENRGNDDAKGSVYVKNYRSALSRLVYVASGEGEEEFAPLHTFFGYRYLELEADGAVEILSASALIISSVAKETAQFNCSDLNVNQLWSNIVWGMRGNYLSIPTDCPQRDERLGWTGDTHIFCGAGSYIADTYDFMRKWLQDARDTQGDDGSYCDVIPKVFKNPRFFGNAAWTDACITVPYIIYNKYGKTDILNEHYDSMERYMSYVSQYGLDGANTAYGDWLSYEETDKRYIAICYYAHTADIMAECADILGKPERAEHYVKLGAEIRRYFKEKYIDEDGLSERTQTAYLLALKFKMVSEPLYSQCTHALRQKIINNGCKLSTGFVGTGILCNTLSELGMHDLCYSLLLQTDDPSWLYSVKQGATTVWERWNSYTLEKGFGDVNMNSFNHYAYGAVAEWMMAYMAGIRTLEPGFKRPLISPKLDLRECIPTGQERITHVNASYDSEYGIIYSCWHKDGNKYIYEISVPCPAVIEIEHRGDPERSINIQGISSIITPEACGDVLKISVPCGNYRIEV